MEVERVAFNGLQELALGGPEAWRDRRCRCFTVIFVNYLKAPREFPKPFLAHRLIEPSEEDRRFRQSIKGPGTGFSIVRNLRAGRI